MAFSPTVPGKKSYQMSEDEARQKRTADWWRHRYNKGHASICPVCGSYTAAKSGVHCRCRKEMLLDGSY